MLRPLPPEVRERLRKAEWGYIKAYYILFFFLAGVGYLGGLFWGEEEMQARYIKNAPETMGFIFIFVVFTIPLLLLRQMIKADELEAKLDDLRSQFDDVIRHGTAHARETLKREMHADFYDDD
mgnify:CR=1 FL=1